MLRLHRAERADRLVDGLATVLADPPGDPFAVEVIAVPTRGVERWLTQRLSTVLGASPGRADGVCANVNFPFPGRLIGEAMATVTGVDRNSDPWLPERAVWPLLDVVDDCNKEPWLAQLSAHLLKAGAHLGSGERGRRFATIRHLADLFDHYSIHRPAMVRAWATGRDTDGDGFALPADLVWQAELWRRLAGRLGAPGPAQRLATACDRLRADPALLDLPSRLSLFGLTRLPASYVEVLAALGAQRDVHLFLLHPSPALWTRVGDWLGSTSGVPYLRALDTSAESVRHPLLASWGRDAREMQLVLASVDRPADTHYPIETAPKTLLSHIQADIRADRRPAARPLAGEHDERHLLESGDRSIQIHACHGRTRQVEVLRDAILHVLADDTTLEPRDIIVMCPDIDTFAPLIHATFAVTAENDDGERAGSAYPDLRVRLADRSLRETNPLLAAMSQLLVVAGGRLTASEVVDFASREPVRRRFHFDDDDLARLEEWVATSGVRWGLDTAHRARYQLGAVGEGTWRAGVDRLLVGVTMTEDDERLVDNVLPLDDVDSGDIDLAGRVAEFVDRLGSAVTRLAGEKPVGAWTALIAEMADELTDTTDDDEWQRAELRGLLGDVVDEAGMGGAVNAAPLAVGDVQTLLADRLRGHPTRANFRTGHLTMCTLMPMRSVPHRVVCLLGLDDGVFPRNAAADGDNLLARSSHVGDRDPRSEDRQLLLDSLLAATERLIVIYEGRDERTGAARPPAVPISELLDVIDATVRIDSGTRQDPMPARDAVVVHHPLQPFDVRNFTVGALVPVTPWSFDSVTLAGARASAAPRTADPAFLAGPLSARTSGLIELDDLVRFVQHPVKAFLRQRVGISIRDGDDELRDTLSVELDPLERWGVGDRLLRMRLAGTDPASCGAAELARGTLPPGVLGTEVLDEVGATVDHLVAAAVDAGWTAAGVSADAHVDFGGGRSLTGTVANIVGETLIDVTFSRLAPKHRLAAWVRYLALTSSRPERVRRAVVVGRRAAGGGAAVATMELVGDTETRRTAAVRQLRAVADLYERGMREPLPLYCATSAAYAKAKATGRDADADARTAWVSDWSFNREDRELEHQLVLGGIVSFEEILVAAPNLDEAGAGWAADESSRFGRLTRRLWDPLLAVEVTTQR